MSVKRFVVRGFDVASTFDASGVIENKPGFKETPGLKLDEVVPTFLDEYKEMIPSRWMIAPGALVSDLSPSGSHEDTVEIFLKIKTSLQDKTELRQHRSEIRDVLKRWAEKSRVRGARGYRVSAVKEPSFRYNPTERCYELSTRIILGDTAFYDDETVSVALHSQAITAVADLKNLDKHLRKRLKSVYVATEYVHSLHGRGAL
jgi:hypothetical protein